MLWHLCTLLCAHHPESSFILSPCMWPTLPSLSSPHSPSLLVTTILLSISRTVVCCFFVLYSTYEWTHIFLSFSIWFISHRIILCPSMLSWMAVFHLFYGWIAFHWIYGPHLLYPVIHQRTLRALAGAAQWIEHWPANQRVTCSISDQGTCLGCGPGPQ